jgi:transcriptional regulator with XRE-family HTH domain
VATRIDDYLRELRHRGDMSQRELSASSGVAEATVARLEAGGQCDPRLSTVSRLVEAAGCRLLIGDDDNQPISPQPELFDICRDLGGRRLPAHLDVQVAPAEEFRPWWQPKRGDFTFARDRRWRDEHRARNQDRVAKYLAERRARDGSSK